MPMLVVKSFVTSGKEELCLVLEIKRLLFLQVSQIDVKDGIVTVKGKKVSLTTRTC